MRAVELAMAVSTRWLKFWASRMGEGGVWLFGVGAAAAAVSAATLRLNDIKIQTRCVHSVRARGSQRCVVSESLVTVGSGETGELGCDAMVVVVKEAKRQDSQLAGQGELVCCVAVVGHRFCSAIFDGSCWCLLDLPFCWMVCGVSGTSLWPGEREMIAERGGSNLLWVLRAASPYKGPCVGSKLLCLPLKTLFQK
jgi:hypothetical protein